tara:strand:+ start:82 stop:501 length:420 start_codon:yes stop_codon:yes gene_type:complete
MADIAAFRTYPKRERADQNYEYYQYTDTNSDMSTPVNVVAAKAGLVGVIDALIVSADAAETLQVNSFNTSDEDQGELFGPHHIAADIPFVLPEHVSIRANAANLSLRIKVTAGQASVFVVYHYETDTERDAFDTAGKYY